MAPSSPLASVSELPNAAGHVGSATASTSLDSGKNSPGYGKSSDNVTGKMQRQSQSQSTVSIQQHSSSKPTYTDHSSPLKAPVLVNPGPTTPSSSDTSSSMPSFKKSSAGTGSHSSEPPPPDPSSFDFSNLLSSIGPEADASITAIAEICGKSKMSLADEHGSHLPPLGNGLVHVQRDGERTVVQSSGSGMARGKEGGLGRGSDEARDQSGWVVRVVKWLKGEGTGTGPSQGREGRGEVRVLRGVGEEEATGAESQAAARVPTG